MQCNQSLQVKIYTKSTRSIVIRRVHQVAVFKFEVHKIGNLVSGPFVTTERQDVFGDLALLLYAAIIIADCQAVRSDQLLPKSIIRRR